MSGWGTWFGGSGASNNKDAPKNAILRLRSQLEMLNKREKHLQNEMAVQDDLAKKYVSTNKTAAKNALRRKKQLEHSLEQTSGQVMTLEKQIYSIESANINKETLDAMVAAKAAMKKIHGGLTIEKVDQTMDELREEHAISEEISGAISQGLPNNDIDQEELDEELERLQQEQLDATMATVGAPPVADEVHRLPAAGHGELKGKAVVEDDEEEELRKLQAEMAM